MTQPKTIRIGVWSGPRNISTALMRSWDSRADCSVVDEPFYGHYLLRTGLNHPARDAVIASQPTDWRTVVRALTVDEPGTRLQYQKHMAHHLLDGMIGPWLLQLRNVLLVRDPEAMLLSLSKVLGEPRVADTGLLHQVELARWLTAETGERPWLLDARTILRDPAAGLQAMCAALGVSFDEAMLSWRAGSRPSDGVWGPHWYASVESSTGFGPDQPPQGELSPSQAEVLARCRELFSELQQLCRPVLPRTTSKDAHV